MILRVVLYAEGGGELGSGPMPPPGDPLSTEMLGPGHFLVQRSVEFTHRIPLNAVQFESPLRTDRGRVAKGSDLLNRTTLRRLLTWLSPVRRPDLAVVLVDSDGDHQRKTQLESYVQDLSVNKIIAVAMNEFEAWLLADHNAIKSLLGLTPPAGEDPETLAPGQAKQSLRDLCRRAKSDERSSRLNIARSCDLNTLKTRCRSFESFLQDLRAGLKST